MTKISCNTVHDEEEEGDDDDDDDDDDDETIKQKGRKEPRL